MNYTSYNALNLDKKTILIVEDDLSSQEFFLIILRNSKATILSAYDGMDAVNIVKTNPQIDLILMDLKMPLLDGFDATRQIKKIRPNIPVIAQSAYALYGDKEKAFNAGCDDYITKPIKKEILFEILGRYLLKQDSHLFE